MMSIVIILFLMVQTDASVDLSSRVILTTGVNYKSFRHDGGISFDNDILREDWQSGAIDDDFTAYAYPVTTHYRGAWIGANSDDVLRGLGITRDTGDRDPRDEFTISENIFAAYTQISVETELSDMPLRVSAGLRYFLNNRKTTGLVQSSGIDASTEMREEKRKSSLWLPTVNLTADLSEDTKLRASLSRNVTRPPLRQLSLATTLRTDNFQDAQTGNPDLLPYRSNNVDLYLENYFGDVGYAAIGVFYKDVKNFITRASTIVPYGELGLPLTLLGDNQNADTPFTFITFVNSQNAEIKGIEAAFTSEPWICPSYFGKYRYYRELYLR